jgi:hypothetical protein
MKAGIVLVSSTYTDFRHFFNISINIQVQWLCNMRRFDDYKGHARHCVRRLREGRTQNSKSRRGGKGEERLKTREAQDENAGQKIKKN